MYYDTNVYLSLSKDSAKKLDKFYLILAGFFAVLSIINFMVPSFTSNLLFMVVGILLIIAALMVLISNFYMVKLNWSSFWFSLVLAMIYLIIGIIFIREPMKGVVAFAFIFAAGWMILGLARFFVVYKNYKNSFKKHWKSFILPVIDIIMGLVLILTWPNNSLFIISLLLGIQFLILTGRFLYIHFLLKKSF